MAALRLATPVRLGAWLDDHRILVVANWSRAAACYGGDTFNGQAPAIIDFRAGTMSFIADPFVEQCSPALVLVSVAAAGP